MPNPGPQTNVLYRSEFEILYGGAKGGGKSALGRYWLLIGNPNDGNPKENPVDFSYINHPGYRALVVRLNRKDAEDWIDRGMRELYSALGATYRESPSSEITFPGGAKIIIDHLADDSVWTKYAGVEFHRMLVEEANQIPNFDRYAMVAINCRSSFPELRPQILLTANPNGPGRIWLSKRFLCGRTETHGKTLREKRTNPFTGEIDYVTRIFVPAKLSDNPKLLESDPKYVVRLMTTLSSKAQERALLHGDWNAIEGQYFDMFRPQHVLGEPENAVHVVPDNTQLMPWWHRWIGVDWGYGHACAVYWGCHSPSDGRVYLYREMVRKKVGAADIGREIARQSLCDLEGLESSHMTLYLSPDAFAKRNDEKTLAEQIAWGIQMELGPDACRVLSASEVSEGKADFFDRQDFQRKAGITIRPAQNQRVAGWEYMRSLMRWSSPAVKAADGMDFAYALKLASDGEFEKYHQYMRSLEPQKAEVMPRLQVFEGCRKFCEAVPSAVYDKDGEDVLKTAEDLDDVLDAGRYCLMGHKTETNREPYQTFQQRRMEALRARHGENVDGNMLVWANRKMEADYAAENEAPDSVNVRRASSRKMWAN